ncbi:protein AIM2 [Aspergillus lentulus]|uniref:Protein AIM2 n=1 Tax=Aspergillus lentulus TaxID=293939 RepID=A0AAN4TEV0_ASPLE|nr:protein AIM2 [Aspergillus lentulus]
MTSSIPGSCCFTGFLHQGDPKGEIEQINNFRAYVARPEGDKTPNKAVILLSDIFGIFPNSQLVADAFAVNGYLWVLPDLLNVDQVSIADYDAKAIDIGAWISRHTVEDVAPIVEATIKFLRTNLDVQNVAAAGYCFGGKYVVRYLKAGQLDSGYIAHPSFVTKEELGAIQRPLSISAAGTICLPYPARSLYLLWLNMSLTSSEHDPIFTMANRHASEETLIGTGQEFQINLFSAVSHGFAIRGDITQPRVRFSKEQAFAQAVAWFNHTL